MGGECPARESGPSTGSTKSQIKDQAAPNKYLPTRTESTFDAGHASPATVAEPAPPTPPKEREKRDSLLCDGDTVDAVLGSVFD